MATLTVVGQRVPKIDAPEKVTGQALYAADVHLPGTLWGKVLRSPLPHARIVRINVDRARALPGVRAVITGRDIPPTLVGRRIKDVPVLAWEVVRYIGDRVAAVAAEDKDVAEEALDLIEVEYEELEPLFDPLEAIRPGAPLLHPDLASYEGLSPDLPKDVPNIHSYLERQRGDLASGFAEADLIVESRHTCAMMHQAYIEPHACLVQIDEDGRIRVWSSNKNPYTLRAHLAQALKVPESRVVVEFIRIGGEFGGKGALMDVPIAYYLARASGRPVRMVMTYNEEFLAGNPRHPAVMTFRTGVRRDGTIVAHEATTVFDSGAYGGFKPVPGAILGGGAKTGGCYRIPNLRLRAYIAYTNHVPGGFMRAPGDPQATFGTECHFDDVARQLGMDPLEFRRKNVLQPGDVAPGGEQWQDLTTPQVLEAAITASRWGQSKAPNVGRGVALVHRHIGGGESNTLVRLASDGRVELVSGVPDAGQGTHTIMRQIAAEVLTIPMEQITVRPGNTDEAPPDPGIGAARHAHIAGQSTYRGAQELAERLRAALAAEMGWDESRISLRDGAFHLDGADAPPVPWAEAAHLAVSANGGPIAFTSTYNSTHVAQECFIAQVAEVEVDPDTGAFKVRQLVTAHDAGQLINPMAAEGQIEGGAVQGFGFAVMEEMRLEAGRVVNPHFGDYKIPCIADVPELKTVWLEAPGPVPFNGRNVAEHSLIPTAAAIGNAIRDAVGVRITSTPITAEKVYQALRTQVELSS